MEKTAAPDVLFCRFKRLKGSVFLFAKFMHEHMNIIMKELFNQEGAITQTVEKVEKKMAEKVIEPTAASPAEKRAKMPEERK